MITITRDKIYRSPYTLKRTMPDSEMVEEIGVEGIVKYMGEEVELGEDLIFKDLFDIIIHHKNFFNILFNSDMGGFLIDDFISDYEKEFDLLLDNEEFRLRFSWLCDIYDYDSEIEYIDFISFEAFGKLNKNEDLEEYPISLAFISLSEIKDKNIFADNTFELQDSNNYGNEIDAIFKANYRPFTVYNIIGSILREITFCGKPAERDAQRKELEGKAREINRWIEEGTFEENIKDFNDIEYKFEGAINESSEDGPTFWDKLYPPKKPTKKKGRKVVLALPESSDLPLELRLEKALDKEDYESAAKIQKLLDNRDGKK